MGLDGRPHVASGKDGFLARFVGEQLWASAVVTSGEGGEPVWNFHFRDDIVEGMWE